MSIFGVRVKITQFINSTRFVTKKRVEWVFSAPEERKKAPFSRCHGKGACVEIQRYKLKSHHSHSIASFWYRTRQSVTLVTGVNPQQVRVYRISKEVIVPVLAETAGKFVFVSVTSYRALAKDNVV